MSFHVGQKVVCVDNGERAQGPNHHRLISSYLEIGTTYTIRKISNRKLALVWLRGVNRAGPYNGGIWGDGGFFSDRFRPLIERSTDTGMAILRKVADDASKKRVLVEGGR